MFSDRNLICKPNLQISIGRFYSTRMLSISSASIWIFLLAVSSRPIDFGRGIKNVPSASLRCLLKKSFESFAISPLLQVCQALGVVCSTRALVLVAAIGQRPVCLHLIGERRQAHVGAYTLQVKRRLPVYTSLCTQPPSSSCDWLTRFLYIACPQFLKKHISTNKPIQGIIDITEN